MLPFVLNDPLNDTVLRRLYNSLLQEIILIFLYCLMKSSFCYNYEHYGSVLDENIEAPCFINMMVSYQRGIIF